MNHALPVALRSGGHCLQKATCSQSLTTYARFFSALVRLPTPCSNIHPLVKQPKIRATAPDTQIRGLSYTRKLEFAQSFARQKLVAYKPTAREQGLSFQSGNLSSREISAIFGQHAPPTAVTNQLLRVLHGRRIDGTLDLPLPKGFDAVLRKYPNVFEDGLQWLREKHPIDEDDAIIRRIEREEAKQEKQNPSDLMRRGEELGLYKPQSGNYQAPLSEREGDVFGVSQIEKRQAENIKKAEREEEELQQEINNIQEEMQEKLGQLAIRPENSLETSDGIRPPNSYEKWRLRKRLDASSKLTLEDLPQQGPWRRLLPSFFFVAVVTGLCYLYAVTWIPPKRSERMFPNVGLAAATVGGIIATNLFIFMLWKFPPAWRLLNKYMITIPGMPVPLSFLGNIFSHQTPKHIGVNMLWLLVLGPSLHEDIGRGNFLTLWVAGGVVGSFVSASSYVFRGILSTSHLGASGAVSAMLAGYFILHAEDRRHFFLMPEEWQETFSFTGMQFLICLLLWEAAQFIRVRRFGRPETTDFAAHFGGYVVGVLSGWWLRQDKERDQERRSKKNRTWIDDLFFSKNSD
jgi:rhomboid-like protein